MMMLEKVANALKKQTVVVNLMETYIDLEKQGRVLVIQNGKYLLYLPFNNTV